MDNKEVFEKLFAAMEYILAFYDEIALKHFNNDAALYQTYCETKILPFLDNFMKQNRSDLNFTAAVLGSSMLRFTLAAAKNAAGLEGFLSHMEGKKENEQH